MFTSGYFDFEVPEDTQGKVPGKWLDMPIQSSEELPGGRYQTKSQLYTK